jgi:hypothetical protein
MESYNRKLNIKVEKKLDEKIRKLANLTDFSISHICREILFVSFKNGIAKDLFWLYMKDHTDPFLQREITKGVSNSSLLKEAFTTIETIFEEQENRIQSLETDRTKLVSKLVSGKQIKLTDFFPIKGAEG